jgi:hypothetical protein
MPLLDPKNLDVADLLAVARDIAGQLDDINGRLDGIDARLNKLAAGQGRAVLNTVEAVMDDLNDRQSLIHVTDDDGNECCTSCLLEANGYPRLAVLAEDAAAGLAP